MKTIYNIQSVRVPGVEECNAGKLAFQTGAFSMDKPKSSGLRSAMPVILFFRIGPKTNFTIIITSLVLQIDLISSLHCERYKMNWLCPVCCATVFVDQNASFLLLFNFHYSLLYFTALQQYYSKYLWSNAFQYTTNIQIFLQTQILYKTFDKHTQVKIQ